MQMRIVDSLHSRLPLTVLATRYISTWRTSPPPSMSTMAVSPRVCDRALKVLLANYSDFNVSTIDSFFQLVLRTFAYETDISDSYRVELESDFLSRMAINAMLDEIDSDECQEDSGLLGAQTDRFRKVRKMEYFPEERSIAGTRHQPLHGTSTAVNRLDNEDFRAVSDVVEDYFRSGPDFKEVFETLHAAYDGAVEKLLAELKEAQQRLTR